MIDPITLGMALIFWQLVDINSALRPRRLSAYRPMSDAERAKCEAQRQRRIARQFRRETREYNRQMRYAQAYATLTPEQRAGISAFGYQLPEELGPPPVLQK